MRSQHNNPLGTVYTNANALSTKYISSTYVSSVMVSSSYAMQYPGGSFEANIQEQAVEKSNPKALQDMLRRTMNQKEK